MKRASEFFLYATVFLTGAAVLVIEIAAVRMLSPYYGASLYVFSSVLTIILSALSIGYYVGGKLADRSPHHEPLYACITLSGLLTLLAQFFGSYILPRAEGIFNVMSGPLLFGFLLFFIPALLLGIDSPYLVKLLASVRKKDEIGSVAGTVFFWGTIGSIVGSLLTGFVLIPLLGIRSTMVGTGLMLVVLGVLGLLLYEKLHSDRSFFIMVHRFREFLFFTLVSVIVVLGLIYRTTMPFPYTVLYESDGVYGHIKVFQTEHEGRTLRALKRDTNYESAMYLDSYDSVFDYMQFAERYKKLVPETRNLLMIGGGGYTLPRTILARDPYVQITVVEIEPDLFPLAQRYFDVPSTTRLTNHSVDGRVFLTTYKSKEKFDVVFLDAFGTDLSLPAHLATHDFFKTLKDTIAREGVLIINYIGFLDGEAPTLTGSLVKTLHTVFPNMKMFAINYENRSERQNIVFVLRNGSKPIHFDGETIRRFDTAKTVGADPVAINDMEIQISSYLSEHEIVFTDDKAPVEYLMLKQTI